MANDCDSQIIVFHVGDKNTKVCTMTEIRCYINADIIFTKDLVVDECNCLPDCTSITYDIETSQAPFWYSAEDVALKNSLNESGYEKINNSMIK